MVGDEAGEKIPAEIKKMSFEDALVELEEIVGDLEQGANKLDEAIRAYERGTFLKKHCESKLREAKVRIEKITVGPGGDVTALAMDVS